MAPLGSSVLVAESAAGTRVHLHTAAPQEALAQARALGVVSNEKIDDLSRQVRAVVGASAAVAVIAVAAGDGLTALFASMGASVVPGGETMNPSAGEIRRGIDDAGARAAIVLPNNPNIVLAAQQAARGHPQPVEVVASRSIPHGVAAMLAFSPDASLQENARAMREAMAGVRHAEVTRAARPSRIRGREVAAGQPIGMVEGELAVAEETIEAAVRACVAALTEGRPEALVTLYYGAGETAAAAEALAKAVRRPGLEAEAVAGGQPHYAYLIGVE
jgi:dihydroxyacetone kinase-like predicted kinase